MRLSVIIVCYGGDVAPLLDELAAQRAAGDEIIVVDNRSSEGGTRGARGHAAVDLLLEPERNLHYACGTNLGADAATGDAIVLLNPDALPLPEFLDIMRAPPAHWAGWTGVLTLPDAERVNNAGGLVHFLGLAYSGRYGRPLASLPRDPYETGFLSGGCLGLRRETWTAMRGFPAHYGAYHEDVDLSLRLRLAGHRFGVLPAARVAHEYDFVKSATKWKNLERNRWKTVVRTYPTPLLLRVLPALLAAEPALLAVGARRGWLRAKLASYAELARWLPAGLQERREVQRTAQVSPGGFARGLVAELDSPFFGRAAGKPVVRTLLETYWRAVLSRLR